MNRYWDVTWNIMSWCLQKDVIYYPMLFVIALCSLAAVVWLAKYIIKGGF